MASCGNPWLKSWTKMSLCSCLANRGVWEGEGKEIGRGVRGALGFWRIGLPQEEEGVIKTLGTSVSESLSWRC